MSDFIQMDDVEFVGPFEETRVVVQGRQVPYLTSWVDPDGTRWLSLDNRGCVQLPPLTAERPYEHIILTEFIANCIAVGMGYTCHPRREWDEPIRRSPFPRMTQLGDFKYEGDEPPAGEDA